MTDDLIQPTYVEPRPGQGGPALTKGRQADLFATGIAALGTILSIIGAIWFFAGFAENDTRPEHLASVLFLTVGLFVLAIGPFAIVTGFARRAYLRGGHRAHYIWTLFLMLPWIGLGILSLTHTPLPIWAGGFAITLSTLLSIWAVVSLILEQHKTV